MAATAVRSSPLSPNSPNGKRKRGINDQDNGRNVKSVHTNGQDTSSEPNYAALLMQGTMNGPDDSTRTAQAALATPMGGGHYPDSFDHPPLPSFDDGTSSNSANPMGSPAAQALFDARQQTSKPSVGSMAWHQQRKDNHKEVERRRREVINEGIENIAKIVPGTEKNKGAILQRTHQYIHELQAQIARFDAERATFEQTLKELTHRHDNMKESAQRAWADAAKWQARSRESGLQFEDYDNDPEDAAGAALGMGEADGLGVGVVDGDGHDGSGATGAGGVA